MEDMKSREQLANIARDYYLSKLTISQISKKYDLSRYLITKALDDAMSTGLVKISINAPIDRNMEMEARFKKNSSTYKMPSLLKMQIRPMKITKISLPLLPSRFKLFCTVAASSELVGVALLPT